MTAVQARGYDDLSGETLAEFKNTAIAAVDPDALRASLAACVVALAHQGLEANLPQARAVRSDLTELQ